jgi:hypothetical protein
LQRRLAAETKNNEFTKRAATSDRQADTLERLVESSFR